MNISIVQTNIHWENIKKNLEHFSEKIKQINTKTDLIILPEMFSTGFTMHPENCFETMDGNTIKWMQQQAILKNAVLCGSIIIKENDQYFNRLVWMYPDGHYNKYDKRHLFSLAKENVFYRRGEESLISEIGEWRFKPLICYDLRFPVWSKNKVKDKRIDYNCLIYVASWPKSRMYAWRSLLIARAIENQSYVIAVNRIGEDGNGSIYTGESMIVDFKGDIIKECKPSEEEVFSINLSLEELNLHREHFKFWQDWDDFIIS